MNVTIKASNVIADAKLKSHMEVASLPVEQRYLVEAGTEKEPELLQSLQEASRMLVSALLPFCTGAGSSAGNDDLVMTRDSVITYVFDLTSRRHTDIADGMHSFLVDAVLGRFYVAVGNTQLASVHENRAAAELASVMNLLHQKKKPRYEI